MNNFITCYFLFRNYNLDLFQVGLLLAAKACFDVREAPAFWAKMELVESNEVSDFQILDSANILKA